MIGVTMKVFRPPDYNFAAALRQIFSFDGRIGRLAYATLGLCLFGAKFIIDDLVAHLVFDRYWSPFNYLSQTQVTMLVGMTADDIPFYIAMLVCALPFIWAGIALTVKRLRSAGLPIWTCFLFFIPMINLLFFGVLCVLPLRGSAAIHGESHSELTSSADVISPPQTGSLLDALAAMFIAGVVGLLLTGFNIFALGTYGLGLFVGLPFCVGLIAAVLYGHRNVRGLAGCIQVSVGTLFVAAMGLLVAGAEGIICLLMATPIWLGCGILGGWVGYLVQMHSRDRRELAVVVIALVLGVPVLMGAEAAILPEAPMLCVTSEVEIDASPSEVWKRVVCFPELGEPDHWLFKAGVAYPIGARIVGTGPGARRYCDFSTGSFVEPIDIWNEPEHLHFGVSESPPPMREWTFYESIHPPHLEGFLNSRAGEFVLTNLPDGGTRLSGTTWYQHNMWPASYWKLWSDYSIHQIHLRVLNHVRELAESEGQ